jgi:hypothetical protein
MLRKDLDDLDENGKTGDWCFFNERPEPDEKGNLPPLMIGIRYGEDPMRDICIIPIARKWREDGVPREGVGYFYGDKAAWEWDGNREAPTLSPSILVHGGKGQPDIWHGFLRAGILATA